MHNICAKNAEEEENDDKAVWKKSKQQGSWVQKRGHRGWGAASRFFARKIFIKNMALMCSIYNVDFWKIFEKHELGIGEDLSGKVKLFLGDQLYKVRCNCSAGNRRQNYFKAEDRKDMSRNFRVVMKPGAHGHVFCAALQFNIRYEFLALQKNDEHISSTKDSKDSRLKNKERSRVELSQLFEIETRALRCTRATQNYQQTRARSQVNHSSVVKMDTHFCRSKATWEKLLSQPSNEGHENINMNHLCWSSASIDTLWVAQKEQLLSILVACSDRKVLL